MVITEMLAPISKARSGKGGGRMKKGDLTCKEIDCKLCPLNNKLRLKLCLSIKSDEKLTCGVNRIKKYFPQVNFELISKSLEREYENGKKRS